MDLGEPLPTLRLTATADQYFDGKPMSLWYGDRLLEHLHLRYPGASHTTLKRRARYQGSRKARRARARLAERAAWWEKLLRYWHHRYGVHVNPG